MDKSAIRNFAIEARKMLMKSAEAEAGFYGVTKNGCKSPIQKGNDFEVYETIAGTENRIYGADIKRRANLVRAVETLGFEQVMEETAYTWFNRIIAIRFMEVNDYLPARVRVLSSETGSNTPDIVTQFLDVDLNMTPEELEKVQKAKDENRYNDAFRILFIKQCNELNAILPGLFEKTDDYMELLLKLSYTSDGVVRMLVDSINENNFNVDTEGQVEIIGWMYQYYNTELKDDTFAKLKKNVKITKERIPAATQLFTPDWIVRYMVENSVGRVWIEHLRALDAALNEQEKAEEYGWKYYLPEAEQEEAVVEKLVEIRKSYAKLEPKDITCIDPCMGSGHILVYMFEVLMDIYRSEGFSEREAVFSILENNIRGLDIDKRAYQLSYFALMMKARGYNRTFFRGKQDEGGNRRFVEPAVFVINESNSVNRSQLRYFGAMLNEIEKNNAINQIIGLLDELLDAREYGSILDITSYDWELLHTFIRKYDIDGQISFDTFGIDETKLLLKELIKQGKVMADKYWIVSTNPPYMGGRSSGKKLSDYLQKRYSDSKSDMFAVFIEKCHEILRKNGVCAMITMHAFMFLSSFERLREKILIYNFLSMIHLGIKAFDEIDNDVVQTTSFISRKASLDEYLGIYCRLVECKEQQLKKEEYLKHNYMFYAKTSDFKRIPGNIFAYWVSEEFIKNYSVNPCLGDFIHMASLNKTGDNEKYLRCWWEIRKNTINERWRFYAKGGDFRRYYGNLLMVVDWSDEARYFYKNNSTSNLVAEEYWYREGITYSAVTSRGTGFRYLPEGCIYDMGGPAIFAGEYNAEILALLNSSVATYYFSVMNPTINLQTKDIKALPVIFADREQIQSISKRNIELAKLDWDREEISVDYDNSYFDREQSSIEANFMQHSKVIEGNSEEFVNNMLLLNSIFANLYFISVEELPEIEERDNAIRDISAQDFVKKFVSYVVGCMFGRYSMKEVHVVEHIQNVDYGTYKPDKDGIIIITDEEYFENDIVFKFECFVSCFYGIENLEDNLKFIANHVGTKGNTTREKIRNYFINDFYKDHCNMYSLTGSGKRPIYWLFDSGKQNGFKCLIYMHRYNKDTLNLIRSEYLHKTQNAVENALKNAEYIIQSSASAVERAKATKDRDRYVKQLNEMRIYYQALSHLALQKIEIDLDDGVKHNYQLFQNIEVIADGGKKQKVNLLAKI